MKKKVSKAIVPKASATNALSNVSIPDYLRQGTGKGMQKVERADLLLPRIKLLQALSPEVSEGIGKPGDMIDSVTRENFGRKISIVPVIHYKSRLLFSERSPNATILCGSDDGVHPNKTYGEVKSQSCLECDLVEWSTDKKGVSQKPDCNIFYNFVTLKDGLTPIGLSLSGSKIKGAKKLLSIIRYTGANLDMFSLKFELSSIEEKGPKGSYFNFKVESDGFNSKEGYAAADRFYQSIKEKEVQIQKEKPEVE